MSNKTDALGILTSLQTKISGGGSNESGYRTAINLFKSTWVALDHANALAGGVLPQPTVTGADNQAIALSYITALTTKINDSSANESGFRSAYETLVVAENGYDECNALGAAL